MKRILLLCFLCSLLIVACTRSNPETNRFPGQREKQTHKRTRLSPTVNQTTIQTATTPSTNQKTAPKPNTESLIFPFILSEGHKSLILKSSDNEKISFSVQPETLPLTLVAGLSGTVSLKKQNETYYLSLTPHQARQILHFELSEKDSVVETSDQAQVSQSQILMKSSKPIVFYITENSEFHILCINTSSIEKSLTVVKELSSTPACQ